MRFVWVFCNFEDVVYIYSENREAETMQTALKEFKGVLVADFYPPTTRWTARSKSA